MAHLFREFQRMEFPATSEIVYVVYFRQNSEETYFYVGQSSRHIGRVGDYISANFKAPTDFKVGEAIRFIREAGLSVGITYKETTNSQQEEQSVANDLRSRGYQLLNDIPGYDYRTADENDERKKIRDFMSKIIHKRKSP